MAFDVTTTPAIDDATKQGDYTRLRDALRAVASAMGGVVLRQGGSLEAFIIDTTEVPVPFSGGNAGFEVDGTYLGYVTVTLEVVAIRHPDTATSVTCTVDLYDATTGAQIASSPVAITLSTANATHQKSTALTLPTSVKRMYARMKTSDALKPVACEWRLVAKGA